jgi:predicted ATP-dependent protease
MLFVYCNEDGRKKIQNISRLGEIELQRYEDFQKLKGNRLKELADRGIVCFEGCDKTMDALTKLDRSSIKCPVVIISEGYSGHFQNIMGHPYKYLLAIFQFDEVKKFPHRVTSLQKRIVDVENEKSTEGPGIEYGVLYHKPELGGKDFASLFVPPMREFLLDLRRAILGLDPKQLQLRKKKDVERDIFESKGGEGIVKQLDDHKGPIFKTHSNRRNIVCILIEGETGSGKSFVAKWIREKLFSEYEFRELNCANLSRNLLESQLFGHMKGSFTDASRTVPGILLMAYGGVVLLDEIGDMHIEVQPKLLKYLEEGELTPFGWYHEPIYCPCLLIAATNVNLENRISKGEFREDLYYRISSRRLKIPPLKERKDDLELLVDMILQDKTINKAEIKSISRQALDILGKHDYPGNFRELEAIMERAVYLADMDRSDTILGRHIVINKKLGGK